MTCGDAPGRAFGCGHVPGEDSGVTVTAAPETQDLLPAVTSLRDEVGTTRLPFDLPGVHAAEGGRTELLRQLDDYILPRLASLDAPLLAVVGGSTGSGKSTLVNSLVESVVSAPGVLRPTTRSPVLVHHPDDERWFTPARILPDLARASGGNAVEGQATMQLVASSTLPPGLALLDAPDIDSVVLGNRELARQLLGAADLWLFVTTAARYADAVPWELLRQASERGTSVAVVLNRVPRGSIPVIREHLASMLKEQGLGAAPIFTVAESRPRRRRHAAAGRGRAAALVAVRPGQGRAGAGPGRPPDADRRPRLAGPAHPGPRRRLRCAGRGTRGAREGGPGGIRRGDQRGRDGDERRVAAARRGARAVAGVRRHRGVLPPGRVDRLSRPRPDRRGVQGGARPVRAPRRGAPQRSGRADPRRGSRGGDDDVPVLARPGRRRDAAPGASGPHPDLRGSRPLGVLARARLAGRRPRAGPRRGQGPAHHREDHRLRGQRRRNRPHARDVRLHRRDHRRRGRHRRRDRRPRAEAARGDLR